MLTRLRLILAALALLVLIAGTGAWILFGPNTPDYEGERGVTIPDGTDFNAVVDSLAERDILASRSTFRWVGAVTGWRNQIKAGYYTFGAGASNYAILNKLRRGLQTPIRLTIPPGSQPEVVAAQAAQDMAFSADSFLTALRDTALAAELGTDTTHLFGYMLPETYFVYWGTPAADVVRRVKQQFDEFYAGQLQSGADSLNLSKPEVVTLASIVEWEAHRSEERRRIAGVYLNRLEIGMALQADPTVQYAILEREGSKRRLLYEDYDIDHPYNTYNYRGLPPGPVTNPSRSALRSVATAEDHDYLYFVANGNGGHTFSRTYQEHVRAANEYRRRIRQRRREQRREDASTHTP